MRAIIFGTIGTLWGAGILVSKLLAPAPPVANAAYQAGLNMALILGTLMFALGIRSVVKGVRKLKAPAQAQS